MAHTVDLAELDALITKMARFEAVSREHLSALDARLATLHGTWTGEAATAHANAHKKLMEGMAEMHQGLQEMRDAARTAHGNYTSAGNTNASMMSKLL